MSTVIVGDCVSIMAGMPASSVDAIVTDPPYGLEFMGKEWDRLGRNAPPSFEHSMQNNFKGFKPLPRPGGLTLDGAHAAQRWHYAWAVEALRVLKPGGHLLAFGGTRTYHRLAAGIEDAGFEIRDTLAWLYGSGFPKSRNLDGDHQGWGTALKPAHEPIVLARKPLTGTVAGNVQAHGTGALNIDGCRIGFAGDADEQESKAKNRHADFKSGPRENAVYGTDERDRGASGNYDPVGRWPANVILDPDAAHLLDSDTGGASRFYYVPKASSAERNAGLDGFEERHVSIGDDRPAGGMHERYGEGNGSGRTATARNVHPTVKPVELMRWLTRLVTPPGGTVLDPFTGSGTTGIAALFENAEFIGIERDPDYAEIADARIRHWRDQDSNQLDLFGA